MKLSRNYSLLVAILLVLLVHTLPCIGQESMVIPIDISHMANCTVEERVAFLLDMVNSLAGDYSPEAAAAVAALKKPAQPQPPPPVEVGEYDFSSTRISIYFKHVQGDLLRQNDPESDADNPKTFLQTRDAAFDPTLLEITPQMPVKFVRDYGSRYYLRGEFHPGEFYQITLKAGFPWKDAPQHLAEDYVISGLCPDLPSQVSLSSEGAFFPLHAPIWELPIRAVNYDTKFTCTLYEPYPEVILNYLRNVGNDYLYYNGGEYSRWARWLANTTFDVATRPNQPTFTALDLAKAGIPRDRPGIYTLVTDFKNTYSSYSRTQSHRIVVTDLALFLTGANGNYLCQVRSLAHPETPVPGVQIELFSQKFQSLAKATTDEQGEARFRVLPLQDAGDCPMLLLAKNPQNNDLAYLDFNRGHINRNGTLTTLRDPKAPQAHLSAERGIALPGDEVTFTALVRNPAENRPVAGLPLQFDLRDPNGTRIIFKTVTTDEFGMLQCTVKLPGESLLGTYDAFLRLPGDPTLACAPSIASTSLLVANFVPDQFGARIDLPKRLDASQPEAEFALQADYYFGAPVEKAKVEAFIRAEWQEIVPPPFAKDFTFGLRRDDLPFINTQSKTGETDEKGHLALTLKVPQPKDDVKLPALPIRIAVQAEVKPTGARAVTARASTRLDAFERYLGSRVSQEEESRVRLQFIALDPENQQTALPQTLQADISLGTWEYLLQEQTAGCYRRIWQYVEKKIQTVELTLDDEDSVWLELPENGNFIVTFQDENGRPLNQLSFWHYAGESGDHSPNPNSLEFKLDNSKYLPGQTAKIAFESNFDGTCLIVSGSHHTPLLSATQPLKVGENTLEVIIPETLVQSNWFVGVTAVGTIREDADGKLHDAPCLTGIARLPVDQSARKLAVTLEAPEQTRLGETIEVALNLADSQGTPVVGEAAIWGVDEGILALTGYQAPDVFAAFFDNQHYPFELNNLYPDLYPMLRVVNGQIGGGAPFAPAFGEKAADFRGKLLDTDETPHVVQLGLLKTDETGRASAKVTLPKFAGTMRLMAIATDGTTRLGNAQKPLVMHDEVTLTLVAPRVVAPGDTIVLRSSVFNQELAETKFAWSLGRDLAGFQPTSGDLAIPKGASETVSARLVIPPETAEGALPILLAVETPEGLRFEKRTVITVRSHIPPQPVCETTILKPGEELSVTLSGRATDLLRVGSPVARLLRHWEWLNDYPYGCLEQITATAFPQLAVADLIAAGRLPERMLPGARQRIQDTLEKYPAYLGHNGWHTMWPNSGYYTAVWEEGSLFAFFFQAEVTRAGFPMGAGERLQRVKLLRTFINDRTRPQEERALALYILSILAPTHVKAYANFFLPLGTSSIHPYAQFLTAMALLRGGYAAEGVELWNSIADTDFTRFVSFNDGTGRAYSTTTLDTPVRRTGLALWLLADLLPDDPHLPQLALDLDTLAADDDYFTTQEHAWYALGLSKYLLNLPVPQGESHFAATLTASDGKVRELAFTGDLPVEVTDQGAYTLRNTGTEPLTVTHSYRASLKDAKDIDSGLHVSREYLDHNGQPVTTCKVGELLTVRITLSGAQADDLVVSDLLPAGLEIEDERLLTRFSTPKRLAGTPTTELTAKLMEKRFDRMLWFGDFYGADKPHTISYQVRAVTPGVFQVPPVQAEAMYRPQLRGIKYPATPTLIIEE
ncbi:MAG: hypothetical protein J5654_08295 [Victivallales bacterium]|nr:hypothetical protein [Victivallales bacterium]